MTIETTPANRFESETPAMDAVTEAFKAELDKVGLPALLEWIDGWYTKVAVARKADYSEIHKNGGRYTEHQQLGIAQELLFRATSHSHGSSMAGTNLMREAELLALAHALRGGPVMQMVNTRRNEVEAEQAKAVAQTAA